MLYPFNTQVEGGLIPAMATYPPKVTRIEVIDYLRDSSGIWQSRDIGRSCYFAGRYYYIFGDTFCKDQDNNFVGLVSNTIASVDDPMRPLITSYASTDSDGKFEAFIKTTEEEECSETHRGVRTTLWCFGGVVETSPEVGWAWFEKGEQQEGKNTPCGGGIAQVVIDQETGRIRTVRAKELLFTQSEPRFGGFSIVLEGDFIYLFAFNDGEIVLARVSRHRPFVRDAYRFWNGSEYVRDMDTKGVLFNVQHGAIFKSTLFGPERPWVFVGCSRFPDSKVLVGAAARIEGPWELTAVCDAVGIEFPKGNMYCMYPHPWVFDETKGELMVTWSENWPGGVVAAKLKFDMGT